MNGIDDCWIRHLPPVFIRLLESLSQECVGNRAFLDRVDISAMGGQDALLANIFDILLCQLEI